ncbi:hypothetical protein STVIR_2155 [Streptomyces viridochromogenes Tue57]|uniref:Uncharacterized protein n=1 Tax=Streptomyces viridochromogenes Tue57 TaxID=1160705 RepID=L8PH38_STRVR|nr:hypothetical protein STVIR_2155 [Streptomyces viridochromogenes Tue57]
MGIPLRWSGEALSKRFDAHSTRGWVSRDPGATTPTPDRYFKRHMRAVGRSVPRRNLGYDPCAPPCLHLTSQQHRSASTKRSARFRGARSSAWLGAPLQLSQFHLRHRSRRPTAGCPGAP